MKKASFYAGGITLLLSLAGCTGETAGEEPPAASAETSSNQPPAPGSASAGPGAIGSQRTAGALEAVLTAVDQAESLNAQVIPDEDLRPMAEPAAGAVDGIDVAPEECRFFAESDPPESGADAIFAGMTFAGESSLHPDSIVLSSFPDEETVAQQLQANRALLQVCSRYELKRAEQVVSVTMQPVRVTTKADEEIAVRTTAQVPGSIRESVTVAARVGSTAINVLVGSSGNPDADLERAAGLVNLVAAELGRS